MNCKPTALSVLILLTAWAAPHDLRAGGFTIIEMGAKKTGMMTCVAKPDDLSAVYHNPAGLAGQRGTRLHLSSGLSLVDASVRMKAWPSEGGVGDYGSEDYIDDPVGADGYFQGTVKPTRYFGLMPMMVASSDFGWETGPVVALGIYVPDFIGAFLPEDAPTRYAIVEGYFTAGVAALSVGYRLPEPLGWLDVGASIGLLYVRMEGKRWTNFPIVLDINTDIVTRMVGEDYRFYFNAGVVAHPLPYLDIGLSLISGANVELVGRLDLSLPPGWEDNEMTKSLVDQGVISEGRYDMRSEMKMPYGLSAGINLEVLSWLEVGVDFRYWLYRTFKEQTIFHNIDISIQEDQPVVDNPIVTPKNYEDSWTISAGVLGRPFELPLELMAGWTYDHSPAPSQTKNLESPTVDLTGFSVGARYTLLDSWRLSFTYYRYWYLRDAVNDSILDPPQNAEFWGHVDTFSLQVEVIL